MMPAVQKIVYDSLRSFGYAYVSTDSDGTVNMNTRPPSHHLAVYPNGHLYEIAGGKYRSVTFH